MAKEIFMPKLSSTMEVGTIIQWFKNEGEKVEVGEPLLEVLTDKINMEVEAYNSGTLIKRYFEEDDEVPVNHVIGYIGNLDEEVPMNPPGESVTTGVANEERSPTVNYSQAEIVKNNELLNEDEKIRATPAARRIGRENSISLKEIKGSGPNGRIQKADLNTVITNSLGDKVISTPLAKKIAEAQGIELSGISGTGVNGKIYRSDVERVLTSQTNQTKRKIDSVRKVIAKRLMESAFTAPHVTITSKIDMSESIVLRNKLLPKIKETSGFKLSYTEIIIKAVAHSLRAFPIMNAVMVEDEILYNNDINIGLAVALEDGLLVPVIKEADRKGLVSLTEECKKLVNEARNHTLKPEMTEGGTFTISNLGMYSIDTFTPIINQPESAILGIGRINEIPVAVNGAIELRPMMSVSLSFDHRIIDGAPAAAFLTHLKRVLEQPLELLL